MIRLKLMLTKPHFIRLVTTCCKTDDGDTLSEDRATHLYACKREELMMLDRRRVKANRDDRTQEEIVVWMQLNWVRCCAKLVSCEWC